MEKNVNKLNWVYLNNFIMEQYLLNFTKRIFFFNNLFANMIYYNIINIVVIQNIISFTHEIIEFNITGQVAII